MRTLSVTGVENPAPGWRSLPGRHCKPLLTFDDVVELQEPCGIPLTLPTVKPDPGLIVARGDEDPTDAFVKAPARHRHVAGDTDPPRG